MRERPTGLSPALLAVAAAAVLSIGWGVWLQLRPRATSGSPGGEVAAGGGDGAAAQGAPVDAVAGDAGTPGGGPEPTPAKLPPVGVRGSGTWDHDAPADARPASRTSVCPDCDVVVVTVCSLRRDHTGPYAETSLTPSLDTLTKGAFRMDQAWSASNFTLASLTAVLTGRFGSSTGVTGWDKGLVADIPTMPEVLGYYGYRTGGFTTDAPSGFRPDYGLDRGFQHMEIIVPPRDNPDGRAQGGDPGPGGAAAKPASAWISAQPKDKPIFVMFHTRTAHYPFVLEDDPTDPTGVTHLLFASDKLSAGTGPRAMPGAAGGTQQRGVVSFFTRDPVQQGVREAGAPGTAMWRQRYAEGVHRLDRDFAVLAEGLKARGRLDKTILIVLADHGESIDDHKELLHGDAYYDGVTHIPMLVRIPGLKGGPQASLVSQVDVLPTVLEAVGAVPPAGIDGASMLALFQGTTDTIRSTTLVEGGVVWHDDKVARGAVISPPWALLRQDPGCDGGDRRTPGQPATCLYNLVDDPGQVKNQALAKPDVVADLQGRWDKFRAAHAQDAAQLQLDPAYIEELQKNGYDFRPEPAKAAP